MKINLNDLAATITAREGGKKNLDIAQVKEVLGITLDLLAKEKPSAVLEVLESR